MAAIFQDGRHRPFVTISGWQTLLLTIYFMIFPEYIVTETTVITIHVVPKLFTANVQCIFYCSRHLYT